MDSIFGVILNTDVLIAIISMIGGGGLVAISKAFFDYLNKKHKLETAKMYSEDSMVLALITKHEQVAQDLRTEIKELRIDVSTIRKEHKDCLEANANIREELGMMKVQVQKTSETINQIQQLQCDTPHCQLSSILSSRKSKDGLHK